VTIILSRILAATPQLSPDTDTELLDEHIYILVLRKLSLLILSLLKHRLRHQVVKHADALDDKGHVGSW
jgi:hypothetical protein